MLKALDAQSWIYSGTCKMRLEVLPKTQKFCHFHPVMENHLSWETIKFSGHSIQVSLFKAKILLSKDLDKTLVCWKELNS